MDAPRFLSPSIDLLRQEFVLVQAWKKASAYIRSHNWYADTLELDLAAVNLPSFLAGLRKQLENPNQWTNSALRIVPAPKSQEWHIAAETKQWEPRPPPKGARKAVTKLRPLAHASLADQVVATAVMMCLADRVEALQGDPRTAIDGRALRKQVISYGNRLFCDNDAGMLSHRWGSSKLYRGYYQDYRRFLSRPDEVAGTLDTGSRIVILQSDLRQFYDRVRPTLLAQKLDSLKHPGDDPAFFDFAKRLLDWRWDARDSREIERRRQDIRWLRILILLTGAIGGGLCRFRLVMCQPDGDGIGLSFGVGFGSVCEVTSMSIMTPKILLLLVLFCTSNVIGHTLEFAGFFSTGSSRQIILFDTETKEVSSWLQVGQEWRGYRVRSFDDKAWTITVTKNDESFVVPLKTDRVVDGKSSPNRGLTWFNLIRGDCKRIDGKWVYSSDAILQFGNRILSATTGVMTSDENEIRGNLSVDSVDGKTTELDDATVKLVNGSPVVTAKKVRFRLPEKQN